MTVVDIISEEEIVQAKNICELTGAKFRVREFVPSN